MKMKMIRLIAVIVTGVVLMICLAHVHPQAMARPVENWDDERLLKSADVVVIATATGTRDDGPAHGLLVGQTTSFDVKVVLKGQVEGKTISLSHYRLKDGAIEEINGQCFVRFRTKGPVLTVNGQPIQLDRPDYLLYLKANADKAFEPVSGQFDPQFSVREMYYSLPNLPEGK